MIHIFTALYPEAKLLIQELNLKKRVQQSHYQQFVSEAQDLTLTLTGVGPMNAAMVVSSVLTEYGAGVGDQLLSLGTAAELRGVEGEKKVNARSAIRRSTAAKSMPATTDPPESLASLYHIHRITDKESGRSFYPDMLLHTGLPEGSVVTGTELLTGEERKHWASRKTKHAPSLHRRTTEEDECAGARGLLSNGTYVASRMTDELLYDMEAAGVYQAASMFLGPHQMNFLRIVTDRGLTATEAADPKALSAHVTECVASQVEKLCEIVDKLRAVSAESGHNATPARENVKRRVENSVAFTESISWNEKNESETDRTSLRMEDEEAVVEKLIADAHFSKVMGDECRQLFRYAALSQLDFESAVEALYRDGRVPTRDKRAGKTILEELKRTVLCY